MNPFTPISRKEVKRINRLQQECFDKKVRLFDPPLPEGVPERLEQIVAAAAIKKGDQVLDVGTGTGILVPLIQKYRPARIMGCDLSAAMLDQFRKNHPGVEFFQADVRDLTLPDASLDVALINACYPNIADKTGAFGNIGRMLKPDGRMVISHPLGKRFIDSLKKVSPFPLDDFPSKPEATQWLGSFGFKIAAFVDEPELYILKAVKRR